MAAKKKKSIINTIVLLVIILLVAIIVYKQVYLVSKITTQLPETALTTSLQQCVQAHASTDIVNNLSSKTNIDVSSFQWKGLFDTLLDKIPNDVINITIDKNYLTEIKVIKVEDFLAKNAQIDINGSLDLSYRLPVVGETKEQKTYQLRLIKRDQNYYFKEVQVKKADQQNWQTWACSQTLPNN